MSSAPPIRPAPYPQTDQTIDRDREELYRRLAKIDKHLDASQRDRGSGESAQPGLMAIIDLLPYAALVRFNGRIDHANEPAGALLAASSRNDLLGLPWRDLLHPEDRPLPGIRPTEQNQLVKRFMRRDGVSFEVSIREIQIPWRGRSAGLILIGEWDRPPGDEPAHGVLGPVAVRALDAANEGVCEFDFRSGELDHRPGSRPCWDTPRNRSSGAMRWMHPRSPMSTGKL
jgi:PAS domain-containing protein